MPARFTPRTPVQAVTQAWWNVPLDPQRAVCAPEGTKANPVKIVLHNHDYVERFFRYVLYKTAVELPAILMSRGQSRAFIQAGDIPGYNPPGIPKGPDLPYLASRDALATSISAKVRVGQWFVFPNNPNTLFFLGGSKRVTAIFELSTRETHIVDKVLTDASADHLRDTGQGPEDERYGNPDDYGKTWL
jgi:hypothetical protein